MSCPNFLDLCYAINSSNNFYYPAPTFIMTRGSHLSVSHPPFHYDMWGGSQAYPLGLSLPFLSAIDPVAPLSLSGPIELRAAAHDGPCGGARSRSALVAVRRSRGAARRRRPIPRRCRGVAGGSDEHKGWLVRRCEGVGCHG